MSLVIKMSRALLLRALDDLERHHLFAGERLGFFSFRQSVRDRTSLLLCYDYHPIPDEQYIRDYTCGARIGGDAIRAAMGRAFRDHAGQLWVHTHGRHAYPTASATDMAEGPKVAQSMLNAQPKTLHGWAVISEKGICGEVRGMKHDGACRLSSLSVVGWPLRIPVRDKTPLIAHGLFKLIPKRRKATTRYDRQDFLGPNSQQIIENTKVGIVGLGGGGSHINQQLAHIGFQKIVLCDVDRVVGTNLNRLIGATLQDLRKKHHKAAIASRLIKKLQPDADIDDKPGTWEDKRGVLRDCDIIFGCVDSFTVRRDLEAFCRSLMIPLIDIGMKVLRPDNGNRTEIFGQAIVSMPGEPCMHCLQFLTPQNLAEEAQRYDAGSQPQVVWSNGVLASTAVGYAMELLTGWSGSVTPGCRMEYRGSRLTVTGSNLAAALKDCSCKHYPLSKAGDPIFKKL
jgi:molybdopterin/thiamine biosynthesis adenylyltransferase